MIPNPSPGFIFLRFDLRSIDPFRYIVPPPETARVRSLSPIPSSSYLGQGNATSVQCVIHVTYVLIPERGPSAVAQTSPIHHVTEQLQPVCRSYSKIGRLVMNRKST